VSQAERGHCRKESGQTALSTLELLQNAASAHFAYPHPVEHPHNVEKVDHAYKSSLKEGGSQPPWAFPPQLSSCPGGTLRRSPRRQLRDGPSCAPIKHGRASASARPLKSGRTAPEANSTRRVLASVHQLINTTSAHKLGMHKGIHLTPSCSKPLMSN
jgi:hypothetical protein